MGVINEVAFDICPTDNHCIIGFGNFLHHIRIDIAHHKPYPLSAELFGPEPWMVSP